LDYYRNIQRFRRYDKALGRKTEICKGVVRYFCVAPWISYDKI
jgi:hypothetical protein